MWKFTRLLGCGWGALCRFLAGMARGLCPSQPPGGVWVGADVPPAAPPAAAGEPACLAWAIASFTAFFWFLGALASAFLAARSALRVCLAADAYWTSWSHAWASSRAVATTSAAPAAPDASFSPIGE